jgi:branched-chain amino acid transport system ATP-binding protein
MNMLELAKVTKNFGGLRAIEDVEFSIRKGEIVGLIGPNGSGKTTLFNLITGVYGLSSGTIAFEGKRIEGVKPFRICHMGIGRTFQITRPFPMMTVRENVAIGAIFGKAVWGASPRKAFSLADEALERVGLSEHRDHLVTEITLADKKKVELAKAIATRPRLLLLDEVLGGLNLTEVGQVMEVIRSFHRSGLTIVLVEHVMKAIVELAERTIVLNFGTLVADGPTAEVMNDPHVIDIYLGKDILGASSL